MLPVRQRTRAAKESSLAFKMSIPKWEANSSSKTKRWKQSWMSPRPRLSSFLHVFRLRDFNAGHRHKGGKIHAGRSNERPVHHWSIQDQTFRLHPFLAKSDLQQACEELQPFCTVLLEHCVPIRIRSSCLLCLRARAALLF